MRVELAARFMPWSPVGDVFGEKGLSNTVIPILPLQGPDLIEEASHRNDPGEFDIPAYKMNSISVKYSGC